MVFGRTADSTNAEHTSEASDAECDLLYNACAILTEVIQPNVQVKIQNVNITVMQRQMCDNNKNNKITKSSAFVARPDSGHGRDI